MDKLKMLKHIKSIYNSNENVIHYLKSSFNQDRNTLEDIMISYDFQAGTYTKRYEDCPDYYDKLVSQLAKEIETLDCSKRSIFECGVGEATILVPLLNKLRYDFVFSGGADISWSRIMMGQKFARKYLRKGKIVLVMGDMFCLPLQDNSIDIVFTRQAIEPNGGHEKEILNELYRVTNEYLILIEPCYEAASEEGRKRMDYHGYIKNLYSIAKKLGFDVLKWEPYEMSERELTPLYIMVIRKQAGQLVENPLCCPVTRTPLEKIGNAYFSEESLLAYPDLNGVPCLVANSAIVTTKMK